MKTFGVDTSTKSISVAICEESAVIGEYFINGTLAHSCTLLPMIDNIFTSAKLTATDIDLFAITTGPGSFTGVRIGVSTIKGMAFALGKPCVSVSSLEAIAYNLIETDCIACPTIDARGGRVYSAFFRIKSGKIERLTPDKVIFIEELSQKLLDFQENIIFLGDASDLCYNKTGCVFNTSVAPLSKRLCKASSVALIGQSLSQQGKSINATEIVPEYITLSQAERERLEKLK